MKRDWPAAFFSIAQPCFCSYRRLNYECINGPIVGLWVLTEPRFFDFSCFCSFFCCCCCNVFGQSSFQVTGSSVCDLSCWLCLSISQWHRCISLFYLKEEVTFFLIGKKTDCFPGFVAVKLYSRTKIRVFTAIAGRCGGYRCLASLLVFFVFVFFPLFLTYFLRSFVWLQEYKAKKCQKKKRKSCKKHDQVVLWFLIMTVDVANVANVAVRDVVLLMLAELFATLPLTVC